MTKFATFREAFPSSDGDEIADGFVGGTFFDFYKPHDSYSLGGFETSLTRQSEAADCDINVIMARYETTGTLPNLPGASYVDFSDPPDLMTAMAVMEQAQAAFMALPARVRVEFDNDPMQFVDFASDPQNLDQMRTWGLAPPAPKEEPKAPPAPPQAPPGASEKAPV